MPSNKTLFVATLTNIFSDLSTSKTAAQKAQEIADAIEDYVKSFSIKTGTLQSQGTGNLGMPVTSQNTTGGVLE